MTSVSSRVVSTKRYEWAVPAEYLHGACWNEVELALQYARQKLSELGLMPKLSIAADDAIRVMPSDEEIIVYITVEESSSGVVRLR